MSPISPAFGSYQARGGANVVARPTAASVMADQRYARQVLSNLATTWESMSGDFHKFRELYYEARLRRAKANQKRKLLDDPESK